jgi:NAD(P)-dependent dehydrogenase (short-subunit alcohol dehydrogenase family)
MLSGHTEPHSREIDRSLRSRTVVISKENPLIHVIKIQFRRLILGRLSGKVALVTGSGRGFGRPIAMAYAEEGCRVVAAALESEELDELASVIRSKGGEVLAIPLDLSKESEIDRMKNEVLDTYGRMDILVNNAAVSLWKTMEEMTTKDWDLTIAVNLRAYFLNVKAFLDTMKKQGRGSIINITSRSAEEGFVGEIAYCPSKFGIEGLTQCMALELRQYNIAVNTLNVGAPPGKQLKPTSLTLEDARKLPDELKQKYADDDSMVKAFSEAWTFLGLQDGHQITGQRLLVRELAAFLKNEGWDAAVAKWRGKLTRAVYTPYDFPELVRYQTPDGGWKELKFED